MKNKSTLDKNQEEQYTLKDFDLTKPEVVRESLRVSPKYEGKLKLAGDRE